MRELKCTNCGATIHTDETSKKIVCNYCGTEYKDSMDYNINVNMGNAFAPVRALVIIMILVIIPIISVFTITFSTTSTNFDDRHEDFQREVFNSEFEMFTGKQSIFFMSTILSKIATNNNENIHTITVYYNDIEATTSEEIMDLLDELNKSEYILNFGYSQDGYINSLEIYD